MSYAQSENEGKFYKYLDFFNNYLSHCMSSAALVTCWKQKNEKQHWGEKFNKYPLASSIHLITQFIWWMLLPRSSWPDFLLTQLCRTAGISVAREPVNSILYCHSLGHKVQQAAGCFNHLTACSTYTRATAQALCQPCQFTPAGIRIRRILALAVLTACIRASSTSLMAFCLIGAMRSSG